MDWRQAAFKTGLGVLHASRAHKLAPIVRPVRGIVFTLHRVRPDEGADFAPNAILEITPEFLETAIGRVRAAGLDPVDLDEAARRLDEPDAAPFAVFTLDDGYRDNAEFAAPVFRRHACPYTIYVPTDFAAGRGELWWVALERAIAENDTVAADIAGTSHSFPSRMPAEKRAAFAGLYKPLRAAPEAEQRAATRRMAERYGIDLEALCRELVMNAEELRAIASDPLCTIGAHSVAHFALAKLDRDEAMTELVCGADRLEAMLGERPRHVSYPYGDRGSAGPRDFALAREAGYATGVTTRPGLLYDAHARHLTALPRVSLNGAYQAGRYVDLFLSGAPFLLYNRGRRLNVA